MAKPYVALILAVLMLAVAGCKKETPPPVPPTVPPPTPKVQAPAPVPAPAASAVSVSNITIGKALGPDKKVEAAEDSFAQGDTIYAVVETAGAGNATLKAKWTYHKGENTAVVDETSQTISPSGPAASEFHVSKPDGWPTGQYQVEISLDDKPAGTKKFAVR